MINYYYHHYVIIYVIMIIIIITMVFGNITGIVNNISSNITYYVANVTTIKNTTIASLFAFIMLYYYIYLCFLIIWLLSIYENIKYIFYFENMNEQRR